jgi:hypothetical protein
VRIFATVPVQSPYFNFLLPNMNLSETFSEAVKLLNILCTLPMTTVESERCFSTLKRIKTFLRNTMGQSRLVYAEHRKNTCEEHSKLQRKGHRSFCRTEGEEN